MDWNSNIGSGIIGGLFSMANTGIQAAVNSSAAKQQFEYDKEMAALQNQYNIDMWQRNNEYNSPAAQMQRLSDAGLNPNLAYGSVSTGNSSNAPSAVAPRQMVANNSEIYGSALKDGLSVIQGLLSLQSTIKQNHLLDEKAEEQHYINTDLQGQLGAKNLMSHYLNYFYDPRSGKYIKAIDSSGDGGYQLNPTGYYMQQYSMPWEKQSQTLMNWSTQRNLNYQRQKLIEHQNYWYDTDQISNLVNTGLRTLTRGFSDVLGLRFKRRK